MPAVLGAPSSDAHSGMSSEDLDPELLRRLQAEIDRLSVSDLLVQTCATLTSVGFARMQGETKDLAQAQLAIDALRALVPVLETGLPPAVAADLKQVVASLQMTFASVAAASPAPPAGKEPGEAEEGETGG